ncbi:MAG: Glu/Leu/Phe/Val dehydrogenase dimerization domain-containing protein [Solirubrobacteraceae bacterium]
MTGLEHERIAIQLGPRSRLPVILAVHSTLLGSAVGGCRMWRYADWRDGLADAMRLSEAMSLKCAAAGIRHGGGKTVIALPPDIELDARRREALMEDVGELVESLGGSYWIGEDVGTGPADILTMRRHTRWTARPHDGTAPADLPQPTATGVIEAIRASARHKFGSPSLTGRRVAVVGLGHVGGPLARMLAGEASTLLVSDVDPGKVAAAVELGATPVEPEAAIEAEVDVLVPAALGGVISPDTVDRLRCAVICGPANNQLTDDGMAELLHARAILWAPDFIVNAGGVTYEVAVGIDGASDADAIAQVSRIGDGLTSILDQAAAEDATPLAIALRRAREVLSAAGVGGRHAGP